MYPALEEMYNKYKEKGFVVLAFPCNQFGKQEPKSDPEIKEFAQTEMHATFPLFSKIEVNGPNVHPIYAYLKGKLTGLLGASIKWNFTKFLIGRDGVPVSRHAPQTKPQQFESDIVKLLEVPVPSFSDK